MPPSGQVVDQRGHVRGPRLAVRRDEELVHARWPLRELGPDVHQDREVLELPAAVALSQEQCVDQAG